MAPLLGNEYEYNANGLASSVAIHKPRLLIIGAGHRGHAYARAALESGLAIVAAVAEPIDFKRQQFGTQYIWSKDPPGLHNEFADWRDFIEYEQQRRRDEALGLAVQPGVDAAFVCVRDEYHVEVLTAIAPLGLHIMSEKPLATTLHDCLKIKRSLEAAPKRVFAIGHVLRYSPHNMLLRDLVLEQRVIGDILSIEHTEPVGWWHFSHSYVRGNWRKESTTAPSLLTKSCHDIDFLLWMMCSPPRGSIGRPHLPSRVSSVGSLKQFRNTMKPAKAGKATNCVSCSIKDSCKYSATRIYNDRHLSKGITQWPVDIVNPEIGSILAREGPKAAHNALMQSLAEDYADDSSKSDIEGRSWYGRCVWESDNDVCDDQYVNLEWEDDPEPGAAGRIAKTASFHMIAQTLAQCERRGRVYGTNGEIYYDSNRITVHDFNHDTTRTYNPEVPKNSHHGGGDDGLTQQFIKAVSAAMSRSMTVHEAQVEFLGCTMEDIIRSHAAVFAAEQARRERKVIEWKDWWDDNVENGY